MNWINIFPDFDPSLIELIEKEATLKTFNPGEIIMRTGQFIKSTALIVNGRVKIYREGPDGGEFLMYYLGPGQACAVSMICAIQARSSEITAVAEEETEILLLPIQLMDQLMREHKSWYQFVIQTYRSRFDELLAVVDDVAFRNMDERLEFYLKRYQEKTGKQKIELSHQQIAEDLNSSREVISRLLKKMEQRGLLKLNRNLIELTS
jgi:CRP/FNR family transcriptional regulator, anaerobic regulatory protein